MVPGWQQANRGGDEDAADHRPERLGPAANEARQILRRQRRHRIVEIEVADIGTDRFDPAARPGATDLATALRRLSPEDRTLLALRHVAAPLAALVRLPFDECVLDRRTCAQDAAILLDLVLGGGAVDLDE